MKMNNLELQPIIKKIGKISNPILYQLHLLWANRIVEKLDRLFPTETIKPVWQISCY
jgi:hypothetical protein